MGDTFCVLSTNPKGYDRPKAAEALAKQKKIPFSEATIAIKHAWGFFAENAPEADAAALTGCLNESGVEAKIILESALKPLPPAQMVKSLELLPDGFSMTLDSGRTGEIKGHNISLFAAAAIPIQKKTSRKVEEGPTTGAKAMRLGVMMATGLPLPIGGKKRVAQKKTTETDMTFYLDLVVKTSGARVRIDGQAVSYQFLGEQKSYSVLQNFKSLLLLSSPLCTSAIFNQGAQGMLGNRPLSQLGYESLEDLDREVHWLLQL